jgi:hypothetical protein
VGYLGRTYLVLFQRGMTRFARDTCLAAK